MARIFISYNRSSLKPVKTLAEDLEAAGNKVWLDQELTGGQKWWDNILANIRECDVFVFALTPESVRSQACMGELGYSVALGKAMLPALLSDDVNANLLPRPLNEIQFVDYRRQDKQAAFALVKAISGMPPTPPLPDPLPEPPPVPLSYLTDLKERIDIPRNLNFQEQITLVFELKEHIGEGRSPEEVSELLISLRQRPDVLAKVRDEIDIALTIAREQSAAPAQGRKRKTTPASRGKQAKVPAALSPQTLRSEGSIPIARLAEEVQRALHSILDRKGSCVLEGDSENYIVLTVPSAGAIRGKMKFRDNFFESKERAIKALGWSYSKTATNWLGSALAGVTWNISRTARDLDQCKAAVKDWSVDKERGELAAISEQLTSTLRKITPDAKAMTIRQI